MLLPVGGRGIAAALLVGSTGPLPELANRPQGLTPAPDEVHAGYLVALCAAALIS